MAVSLPEFLLARLAEDEAGAEAATPGPWDRDEEGVWSGDDPGQGIAHASWELGDSSAANLEHIARHDPARVLAEVAAKRAIVENCERARQAVDGEPMSQAVRSDDPPIRAYWRGQDWVLKQLALPYADHPDYREEWVL